MARLETYLRELWNFPKQTHRPIIDDESDKISWEEFSLRVTKSKEEISKAIIDFYGERGYLLLGKQRATAQGQNLFTIDLFNGTRTIGVTISIWEGEKIVITVVLVAAEEWY